MSYFVEIKAVDMSRAMQRRTLQFTREAFDRYTSRKDMADHIKDELDDTYGGRYHCIVGTSFGFSITSEKNHIVFYARLSSSIYLNIYSVVKFDEVVINVGNHYNSGDGIFVAPITGVDQFSWMTLTDVVIDTLGIGILAAGTILVTRLTVCKVDKDDHVWIQTAGAGNIFSIAFFNFAGISVTREISATTRMVLDSVRTIIIWVAALALDWQKFIPLQILGFVVLIIGMMLYNDICVQFIKRSIMTRVLRRPLPPDEDQERLIPEDNANRRGGNIQEEPQPGPSNAAI
ncbi:unnamed protein product [Mytilus edulis]|uniref:C1q domain-containing protein n=1 Tax=Mytilus edulis TaxID=6550 RepID=A0A8S3QDL5_MYTED|nr:unnamed protein product [Mytilus edulis]